MAEKDVHIMSRAVVSGDTVEMYMYSAPIRTGYERMYDIVKRDGSVIDDDYVRREGNLHRARQTVRRIIWSNQGKHTKFVTLTYAQTVLEVKKVQRDIRTFVQAMRRAGYEMNYLYVLENQTERGEKEGNEGCLHVHMLIFNDNYLDFHLLNKCWKHGSTNINSLVDVRNVGAYICKYITKQGVSAFGRQAYSCSNGLKRPVEERFYTEGLSDTTIGLHPDTVLTAMDIDFYSTVRHDYRDSDGVCKCQTVGYYQGKWKDGDIIEQNKDI